MERPISPASIATGYSLNFSLLQDNVHSRPTDDTVSNAPTYLSLLEEDDLRLTLSDINIKSEADSGIPKTPSTGNTSLDIIIFLTNIV